MTEETQPWPRDQRIPTVLVGDRPKTWHVQALAKYDAAHNTVSARRTVEQVNRAIRWWNDRADRLEPASLLADLAPHGGFAVHASDDTRGPNNELAVYVICACGRGYSWERKIPDAELVTWLSNHGPDIPLDEEEWRVKAAGGRTERGDESVGP